MQVQSPSPPAGLTTVCDLTVFLCLTAEQPEHLETIFTLILRAGTDQVSSDFVLLTAPPSSISPPFTYSSWTTFQLTFSIK